MTERVQQEGGSTLSWRSAVKIAWRDMRASLGKFAFVIVSVAIGVGALTGVRGFSEAFKKTLLLRARSIMAADLSARMFAQPAGEARQKLEALKERGLRETWITEMVSMASTPSDPNPLLISLKAVDPAEYPFYGDVVLSPAGKLKDVLTDGTVVVVDDLLVRLRAHVGDTLRIGGRQFVIAAVLVSEPDRLSATLGLGPRVMMTRHAVEEAGLLQPGSRSGERYLFQLPAQGVGVDEAKSSIEQILPDAQVTDYRETNPALSQGLERSTSILSLISLVAMVLGAIGVGMAMHAHLQQRLDTIAIMKSLGARSAQILKIYLLQTLILGVSGGLLGVALGAGVERAFPVLLEKFIALKPETSVPFHAIAIGLGTGVLTTLLFTLPALLDIRKVRPSLILRRAVEDASTKERGGWWTRLMAARVQLIAGVLIVSGLALIAATVSDSRVVGEWFAAGLIAVLAVLLGVAAGVLKLLRQVLEKSRAHLPSTLRHGLANLYRPGNQSAAVLAALGVGVMLILSVFLMEKAVVGDLRESASPTLPNIFLIDMSTQEVPGIIDLLKKQPGMRGKVETVPVVAARVMSIDGVKVDQLKLKHSSKRFLQSVSLTWSDGAPVGAKVMQGSWWRADEAAPVVAISEGTARRLEVHTGSTIEFDAGGKTIAAKVVATYKSDGEHAFSRSEYVMPQKVLDGLTVIWYGAAHIDAQQVGVTQRALYANYPTVTVINVADALEIIRGVVNQIATVVRFLAAFSILSGAIILASSIAGTRFRRIREVVVLKTLGGTRQRIAAIFSIEFLTLGSIAGLVGAIFATLLTRVLLKKMEVPFRVEWLANLGAIAGTAVLASVTGWVACYRILGQKPLEVLREE